MICSCGFSGLSKVCEYRDREPVRLRKPAPAPKASPPRRREPEYLVRLSTRPVTALERDYNDVIDRYPRLYVSADFAKSVSCWVQVLNACASISPIVPFRFACAILQEHAHRLWSHQ